MDAKKRKSFKKKENSTMSYTASRWIENWIIGFSNGEVIGELDQNSMNEVVEQDLIE